MFCEKCGREIVHDSVYCSYCGKRVEGPQEERREEKDDFNLSEPAECIKPHMPKKHCEECGKELPGSTISNVCALCTVRRRNREEEQRRQNAKTDKKRDRYDRSDQFDRNVNERSQSSYYREPTEPEPVRVISRSKIWHSEREEERKDARRQRNKKVAIIAVGIFLVFFGLITVLPFLLMQNSRAETVSVAAESEISYEELPDLESAPESAALDTSGDSVIQTLSDLSELADSVAEQILAQNLEGSTAVPSHDRLTWDGAYIYTHGTVVYKESSEFITRQYDVCMMLTERQYLPVRVMLGNETLFDNRDYIDPYGSVTEEGAEFFEVAAGTFLFGAEQVIFPENLTDADAPDTKVQNV